MNRRRKATATEHDQAIGLSSEEAQHRLTTVGPNATPDTALHPLREALATFWAPVPGMLGAAVVPEVLLGRHVEAAIIAALLMSASLDLDRRVQPERVM